PYGVVRIDSACSPTDWAKDPETNQKSIAETFRRAAAIARDHGERLAAEGEICWGGMHSWRTMVDLLEQVGEPETVGFQADIPHHAGFWLRDERGKVTRACRHICWDGCMFPNEVMMKPQTWSDILQVMIQVRDAHGWSE